MVERWEGGGRREEEVGGECEDERWGGEGGRQGGWREGEVRVGDDVMRDKQ